MNAFLPPDLRSQIVRHLAHEKECNDFGDGQNLDYCLDGFPIFKGYNNYTDEELILALMGEEP